jgi:5-methylthioadenosine/S-adenosylhomocysteine deaminase
VSLAETLRRPTGALRLRARWALPIHLPPIADADVVIEDGGIVDVGPASSAPADIDLGLCAILPGLVNTHAHLEYTLLRGLVEDRPFFPWVRTLTALKAFVDADDWLASASLGAAEMAAAGVTTVGDCSDAGASLPALITAGLRGIVYREVFGIEENPTVAETVDLLRRRLGAMRAQLDRSEAGDRVGLGISPHAPYTVRPALLTALADFARSAGLPQQIHLAESPAEQALFADGSGGFAEMLAARRIAFAPLAPTAIAHVEATGALDVPGTLAVHCVHASAADIALLAEKGVAVAHCPRSNGKLAAGFAPLAALRAAGLAVGIGSDSVVSGNAVDLFEELRFAVYTARSRESDAMALTARQALAMATIDGARALGLADRIGTLERGKRADLCIVRLDGLHLTPNAQDSVEAALVYAARASDVLLTIVDGQAVYDSGRCDRLDLGRLRRRLADARARVRREGGTILGPT